MSKLISLLESLDQSVIDYSVAVNDFNDKIESINEELALGLTGEQTLALLQVMQATPKELDLARLRIVTGCNRENSMVFRDVLRLKFDNRPINVSVLADGAVLVTSFNAAIEAVVKKMFEVINQSKDDNREHKAICLRRDVARLKWVVRYGYVPGFTPNWEIIEPTEDYIDSAVDFGFLNNECDLQKEAASCGIDWWCSAYLTKRLLGLIQIRQQFLARLLVFNVSLED